MRVVHQAACCYIRDISEPRGSLKFTPVPRMAFCFTSTYRLDDFNNVVDYHGRHLQITEFLVTHSVESIPTLNRLVGEADKCPRAVHRERILGCHSSDRVLQRFAFAC